MFLVGFAATSLGALPASAQGDSAARRVRVNDIEMAYEVRGSGEPLVLLHGFFGCGDVWDPFVARLAERYRLIIPDLREHGGSTNPRKVYTHDQSAKDIAALLDSLGLRRVRALGISSGGMTLLHLATQQPDRLEAMVLIGATTHFGDQAKAIMRATGREGLPPHLQQEFLGCATRGGEVQLGDLRARFAALEHTRDMAFTARELGRIRARTLIVHGDRDEFFPVSIPVAMYRGIPGSALWIVPGGDHVPIYGKREGPFLDEVMRFLEAPKKKE